MQRIWEDWRKYNWRCTWYAWSYWCKS